MMIERKKYLGLIRDHFDVTRIVALLGPRQCGKTTLSKQYSQQIKSTVSYFDLENPVDLEQLRQPILALKERKGLVVIDEVQRLPELFTSLRYIHDENPEIQFLILGSASRELIRQSSESLAGRIGYIEVNPFDLSEVKEDKTLLLRGGFPKSFLATSDSASFVWRKNYVRTYIEQDLPSLGLRSNSEFVFRLWSMLTHYHGQIFNNSEIATSLMISRPASQNYLELLAGTFMIRILSPWFENIGKRQVKSPKVYFRDSGILNYFLGNESFDQLLSSPKLGAVWEGFALENIINSLEASANECYFWSTHNQAELDLLVFKKGKRLGFEFKYVDAPTITKSMRIALNDLSLDQLTVIYPGEKDYELSDRISVRSLSSFVKRGYTALGL